MRELELISPSSQVITSDLNPHLSSACHVSHKSIEVSPFNNLAFVTDLVKLCLEHNIKMIVPTIDTGLQLLSDNASQFLENGIIPIISKPHFITICRNKRLMTDFFHDRGFMTPPLVDKTNPTFPIFIKPIDGSSSNNLHYIDNPDKLSKHLIDDEDLIWMKYIPPAIYDELTIDLYYNRQSKLVSCVPRLRLAVRSGETNKGRTIKDQSLIKYIKDRLHSIPGARGCLTLQLFRNKHNKEDIYGIEINPRFGGGYPLSYLAGANYPQFLLREYFLGDELGYFEDWKDDLLLLRYDSEMIIDGSKNH